MYRITEIGENILNWIADNVLVWVIIALLGFAAVLIAAGIYSFVGKPTITLSLSEWECVETATVRHNILMPVGKVLVPTQTDQNECVQYRRKYGE